MATMNISLTDDLKDFVEQEVQEKSYTSSSELLRELIRQRRDENFLRQELLSGIQSGHDSRNVDQILSSLRDITTES